MGGLRLYTTYSQGTHVNVDLKGDLDWETTEIVHEEILPLLLDFQSVTLNFSRVPFVDSSGMGALIELVQKLNEANIEISISEVNQDVLEVFELIQLPDIIGRHVFV